MDNVDSGYMLKVHEAAPNVLVSKDLWLGHVYPLAMNKQVWDELAQEDKDAVHRATETSYQSLGSTMDESFNTQLDDLRAAGASVRILDRREVERWAADIGYREIQSAWVRSQEAKGVAGVGATLDAVTSIMTEMAG